MPSSFPDAIVVRISLDFALEVFCIIIFLLSRPIKIFSVRSRRPVEIYFLQLELTIMIEFVFVFLEAKSEPSLEISFQLGFEN